MPNQMLMLTVVCCLVISGCFPGVKVRKNPGPKDTGVRYYRPKPYLLLSPVAEGEDNDQHVAISLVYLPDYSEEYSINVKPGFGSANVQIKLDQGWNLTQLNQDLDSQTDEIISAVGDVLGKLPLAGSGGEGRFFVRASNVPLGYYEAVIDSDPNGCKQLYGWRYVGFLPYRQCPVTAGGLDSFHCNEVPGPLFGLVFESGTLTFKRLDAVEQIEPELIGLAPPADPPTGSNGIIRLPPVK